MLATYQAAIGLAQVLKEIMDNPNVLEDAAKQAYTLGTQGEARLKEAQQIIADADKISTEHAKREAELEDVKRKLGIQAEELNAAVEKHASTLAEHVNNVVAIENAKKDIAAKFEEHKKNVQDLHSSYEDLAAEADKLKERETSLEARIESVNRYKEELDEIKAKLDDREERIATLEKKIKGLLG